MYWNARIHLSQAGAPGLTLTWDVLKLHSCNQGSVCCHWLTLTWDVLKLASQEKIYHD